MTLICYNMLPILYLIGFILSKEKIRSIELLN